MKNATLIFSVLVLCSMLAACKEKVPTIVDATWLGKWNGPEGTFLNLEKDGIGYSVIIQDLDGPTSFYGTEDPNGITFVRGGTKEIIRVGNGKQTGMKWLADKKDCLVIKIGEGYCRD